MASIADHCGWLGALLTISFFAYPIYKYYHLIKNKIDYKEIRIFIIVVNYFSSLIWLIYGYEAQIKQIKVCYSLGLLISFILLWIYLAYMGKEKMIYALIYTTLLTSLTFGIFVFLELILNDKKILREICCLICTLLYISPAPLLIKVLNSKNYKIIPIYEAIFSAIIFGNWAIFGFFKINAIIIIPYLIGLSIALAQIILYRYYKNERPLTEEIGNISQLDIGTMKNISDKTVELSTYPKNNNENDEPLINKDKNNNDISSRKKNEGKDNEVDKDNDSEKLL